MRARKQQLAYIFFRVPWKVIHKIFRRDLRIKNNQNREESMQADPLNKGQLVAAPANQGLPIAIARQIRESILGQGGLNGRAIEVLVTSGNALKKQAAQNSVTAWIQALFNVNCPNNTKGYSVASEIDEQPHGLEHTTRGAENRLKNMKVELAREGIDPNKRDGVVRILISLENGVMKEVVNPLTNPVQYQNADGTVWVDRCVEKGELWFQGNRVEFSAVSEGVTTPRFAVEASEASNWTKTAGSFIAERYQVNAQDWHGYIAGKGRQAIMELLAQSALGLPYRIPAPAKDRTYDPERDSGLHQQYVTDDVTLHTSKDFKEMEDYEIELRKRGITQDQIDRFLAQAPGSSLPPSVGDAAKIDQIFFSLSTRRVYDEIPLPRKKVEGGEPVTINTDGVILTEDVLVCYFDVDPNTPDKREVLHAVLLWTDVKGVESGWVLPGKRDRAYSKPRGDVSVRDATFSLIEKELRVDRAHIAYYTNLGYFDDRKRDDRMKTSGLVTWVLLDRKPDLEPGKCIGIPMNLLEELARKERKVAPRPHAPESEARYMARHHDSLLVSVLGEAKCWKTMENVKQAQAKWRESLRANPRAPRPPLSENDPGTECISCLDLLVGVKMICSSGHSICSICLPRIQQANNKCPECRETIPPNPPRQVQFEKVIQAQNPKRYAERFREMRDALHLQENVYTWKNDPTFVGSSLAYQS